MFWDSKFEGDTPQAEYFARAEKGFWSAAKQICIKVIVT
jgi:hypothetical protein